MDGKAIITGSAKSVSILLGAFLIYYGVLSLVSSYESSGIGALVFTTPEGAIQGFIYGVVLLLSSSLAWWKANGTFVILFIPLIDLDATLRKTVGVNGWQKVLLVQGVAIPALGLTAGILISLTQEDEQYKDRD